MSLYTNWCSFFLLNSAWQILILSGIAALLVRFLPWLSNNLEHRLWIGCLLLGVTVPSISTYLGVVPVHNVAATVDVQQESRWKVPHPTEHGRLTQPLTALETTQVERNSFQILAAAYSVSVFIGFVFLLLRIEKTRRTVKSRRALTGGLSLQDDLAENLICSRRQVNVFLSSELNSPATVNWPGPMILVPEALESMDAPERATVLAHEMAHVQRKDFQKNLLLEVVSLLLCYHPMIWWLKRRISASREAICDEIAAEVTLGRATYAQSLLNVAEITNVQARAHAGLALGIANSQLERRIMKLLQAPQVLSHRRRYITQGFCLLALLSVSVGILSLGLHPSSVQAAGLPAFPFDPTQTFDTLKPKAQRKQAPNFTLVDNSGKTITLSDYKGKVVLLDFWATWCGGCKLEIPWYMEFDRKYRKDGLTVIGVSMDENGWDAVRPFLAKKHDDETGGMIAMQYPIVIGNDAMGARFGLTSMPMTLLIDKDGKVAVSHTGVVDKQDFETNIRQLLKQ